jgi:hypothetical protein
VGKQKTYGRFLGTIFLEEVGAAHPVPGELVANVNLPKTVKNRKEMLFLETASNVRISDGPIQKPRCARIRSDFALFV